MMPYDLILLFFVYGLAFFSMGIAMTLETGRSPLLAEARALRPLAVFGLMHGIYEWIILFIIQMRRLEIPVPGLLEEIRLGLLVISFVSLLAYGVRILRLPAPFAGVDVYVGLGMLGIWGLTLAWSGWFIEGQAGWIERGDLLARYLLAIPGSLVAAFATYRHAQHVEVENRRALEICLKLAAWGFAGYAFSQVFVFHTTWGLAKILNMDTFREIFGVPIQPVRATLALLITVGLIHAIQVVDEERQRILSEAQQARLEALEQVREELLKQEAIRRQFLREMVVKQEEERARLSRELHDETAQTLTAIQINLAALQTAPNDAKTQELFSRLYALSDQIAQDIHRMVHDLRPAQLDDLGLSSALEFLIEDLQRNSELQIDLRITGSKRRLEPLTETVLYRVGQEALTNVVRHAQTKKAQVKLHFAEESICLTVLDEGIGFDLQRLPQPSGRLGLVGMQERVESVGGHLEIRTAPGQGTHVKITIPFQHFPEPYAQESLDGSHSHHAR